MCAYPPGPASVRQIDRVVRSTANRPSINNPSFIHRMRARPSTPPPLPRTGCASFKPRQSRQIMHKPAVLPPDDALHVRRVALGRTLRARPPPARPARGRHLVISQRMGDARRDAVRGAELAGDAAGGAGWLEGGRLWMGKGCRSGGGEMDEGEKQLGDEEVDERAGARRHGGRCREGGKGGRRRRRAEWSYAHTIFRVLKTNVVEAGSIRTKDTWDCGRLRPHFPLEKTICPGGGARPFQPATRKQCTRCALCQKTSS